ncbi:MAG TPA: hypothetical protein V6C98_13770, partial [Thermosynechococcaceae cyanobacterium]
ITLNLERRCSVSDYLRDELNIVKDSTLEAGCSSTLGWSGYIVGKSIIVFDKCFASVNLIIEQVL